MVRFIIFLPLIFAFLESDLHSNMVRFIILVDLHISSRPYTFTFQYGQIYYFYFLFYIFWQRRIYIPIWLDLLYNALRELEQQNKDLHSNMVRFIIFTNSSTTSCGAFIYIPIWLDLLSNLCLALYSILRNLHSNMVRFIILFNFFISLSSTLFTFQYGQIYYCCCSCSHIFC